VKINKTKIGPVQLLAISFPPEAKYEGKILKELERLDRVKTIRILDLLFVKKDQKTSDLIALSIQGEKLGAIVGALMGFEFDGEQKKQNKSAIDSNKNSFGLTAEAIENIGKSLEPGMAAGVLLIEHVWAKELKQAIREAGGVPIAEGFLTPEVITKVAAEIEAISQAISELEEAELHEQTSIRAYN
jgi:uncharacterized membrane protein